MPLCTPSAPNLTAVLAASALVSASNGACWRYPSSEGWSRCDFSPN
ncbi:hypothetical protein [Synechococcus sp. HB1133]|nr:hypothetical protein [Synechococcus sp. HB1133]